MKRLLAAIALVVSLPVHAALYATDRYNVNIKFEDGGRLTGWFDLLNNFPDKTPYGWDMSRGTGTHDYEVPWHDDNLMPTLVTEKPWYATSWTTSWEYGTHAWGARIGSTNTDPPLTTFTFHGFNHLQALTITITNPPAGGFAYPFDLNVPYFAVSAVETDARNSGPFYYLHGIGSISNPLYHSGYPSTMPVPEPSTWGMLALGLGVLGWSVMRKRLA